MLAYRSTADQNYSVDRFGATPEMPGINTFSSIAPRLKRKTEREDTNLVERLKAGDEQALETIFTRYAPKLYNVAQKILGDVADAEEVIQDVFWTAFRKAKSFRGTAQFSTWLYRLTVNAALGKIRRSKKNKEVEYEEYLPKFQQDGHHLVRPVVDWSDTLDAVKTRLHRARLFLRGKLAVHLGHSAA